MLKLIAKFFGTKSEKDIKRVMPLVEQTKQEWERVKTISQDELPTETKDIQETINLEIKGIDDQLAGLHNNIADDASMEIKEKETGFAEIDKLEEDGNKELEKVLLK